MKADLWRYLILGENGGVSSDIDSVCLEPLDLWVDRPQPRGADVLILALENAEHFCQWTIAATPGHPAPRHTAAFLLHNFESRGIDTACEPFVHRTTGPGIWTVALKDYLGADASLSAGRGGNRAGG
jgi:alpha 1,6-mannosyltransferase